MAGFRLPRSHARVASPIKATSRKPIRVCAALAQAFGVDSGVLVRSPKKALACVVVAASARFDSNRPRMFPLYKSAHAARLNLFAKLLTWRPSEAAALILLGDKVAGRRRNVFAGFSVDETAGATRRKPASDTRGDERGVRS